ncbi:hypothetical protein C2U70_13050 [Bradyrhizobium guangdongense]|uniref:hypothetical protein n=1 Tax=Bradyrhizobium guangdongense TaxID=1325090 RepID=UPI001125DB1A|nr:hypothetical protein [Bradyrhizobium guangdongense]TPQ36276.1 hypothetical protein C2U70_13050 [Bradyrhizobium guangdongense]
MILLRLAAVVSGALVAFASVDHLLPEELCIMSRKAQADETAKMAPARTVPPARDPAIAVAEEYELARRKGTAEAFELFIARHGDDPLAEKARAELKRLSR